MLPNSRDQINKDREVWIIILSTVIHRDPPEIILNNLEVVISDINRSRPWAVPGVLNSEGQQHSQEPDTFQ